MSCNNCSNITLPQGSTGDTGATGADGLDGVALLGTTTNRPSTSSTSLASIVNIPIDVSTVFSETGDALEFEVLFSYNYVSGTDGGQVLLQLQDGTSSISIPSVFTVGMSTGLQGCSLKGTIIRDSDTSITYSCRIEQLSNTVYSAPTNILSGAIKQTYIDTSVGLTSIDNTSANLKLVARGVLNAGTNNIKVEFFKLTALKLI